MENESVSTMSHRPHSAVDELIAQLRTGRASGIDQYERRLRDNARNPAVLDDLLFEGQAALMFLCNGWQVTLRERPDLQIALAGEVVYGEVKHFQEKEQDRLDEQAMSEATDELVRIGDLAATEGVLAWKQLANVAVRKVPVYMPGAPNILIVESSSASLDLMVTAAVHEYDDEVMRSDDPRMRRLNAIMLVNTGWVRFGAEGRQNIEFCQTSQAAVPLSDKLAEALANIRLG